MLTSNLWKPDSLHNGARREVDDFFYMKSDGPLYQTLLEAIFLQFSHLDTDMPYFL